MRSRLLNCGAQIGVHDTVFLHLKQPERIDHSVPRIKGLMP